MRILLLLITALLLLTPTESTAGSNLDGLYGGLENLINSISKYLAIVLFYEVPIFFTSYKIPFLVLWLISGGLFFTIRLGFINLRLFFHAFAVIRGKYTGKDEPGEVTHAQAFFAAVSATVGIGNIGGVSVAVMAGGPGAIFWMILAGILGMSTKFAEVTLGQKYRKFDKKGRVSGGAFHYLRDGLAELNMPKLGKVLAVSFAFLCLFGSFGAGNMFQSNQAIAQITHNNFLSEMTWLPSIILAITVGLVLIGGIKRIAIVAQAVVPLMAFIYISAALAVVIYHIDSVGTAFSTIISDAFTGEAIGGGIMGALIAGFKRSAFSNEAGLGSAPIAHSAARTKEPVREGAVAILEPFLDTVIICTLTGLVITITGVYKHDHDLDGILLTSTAFESVISWFPKVITVAATLFAFSTMLSWSYYGERSWTYLFGHKTINIYYFMFCSMTIIGGITSLDAVITLSDLMLLSMAIPNLIGLYLLSPMLSREVKLYVRKLKNKEFEVFDHSNSSKNTKKKLAL